MSGQLSMWDDGPNHPENGAGMQNPRASLYREMRYLFASSRKAGGAGWITPTGLAHSLGVCLIEDWHMSRGKGKDAKAGSANALPRFVDVKLTAEQRAEFSSFTLYEGDPVRALQSLADDGYRVGVSWSGEQQAYTISLTCRNSESVNNGMCMTSFAGTLETAVRLAVFKHVVVCNERWVEASFGGNEEFG